MPTTTRVRADQRRRLLAEQAARRFCRLGFHGVALADVAAAAGVTAPAVYRHFRNKNALLAGAIDGALDVVHDALTPAVSLEAVSLEAVSLEAVLPALADAALRRRDLWVLLQREMRHLDGAERVRIRARFAGIVGRLAALLRDARPAVGDGAARLLVAAVLGALASPAVSRVRAPRPEYHRVLTAAARAAAGADLPAGPGPHPAATAPAPRSRGEQLLATAIALFHERGYAAVSLDDIGAAVGMAGPSIYHHFATKSELLETAFHRAARGLTAHRPDAALPELVRGYVDAGVAQPHLFGVYVTESINLPRPARTRIAAELTASAAEWTAALRARRPGLTETQGRVLVHAARGVAGDVVRMPWLHARPNIAAELSTVLLAVLHAELPGGEDRPDD